MAKVLEMPKLSPTMEEGVLAKWHKKEGDTIGIDDLLAEVETDKATMEFRSFDAGTILKLLVSEGATIKLGQPVAVLGKPGEDASSVAGASAEPPKAEAKEEKPKAEPTEEKPKAESAQPPPSVPPRKRGGTILDRTEYAAEHDAPAGRVLASPFVRKTARELGVDLAGVKGTGPMGRLTPEDVSGAKQAPATPQAQSGAAIVPAPAPVGLALAQPDIQPLSPMRKTIAKRLVESKRNVPHFYLTVDLDVEALTGLRERINKELLADLGERATKVSLNDFVVKACAIALVRVPACNAQFSDEGILTHKRVDVSVAVAVEDGLVTPVVRNADQKSVSAIAREIRELAGRARTKKLKPEEMTNGTFSVSNLGMFGIDQFAAVINPPEGAILAVGQMRHVPVVKDGSVVPGQRMSVTLSCDHRVVDGAVGAAFLSELRALVEHPMQILV